MHFTNTVKFAIQRALRSFGWEMRRFELGEAALLAKELTRRDIRMVLDVGANQGQYAAALYSKGYAGKLVSFEPLSQAHRDLSRIAARHPGWAVHRRCALGARPGTVQLNVSENLVSSSILPMQPAHTDAARSSRYVSVENTDEVTLDSLPEYWSTSPAFLKIDTQGYELEVLKGAEAALRKVAGVQLELSLAPLYQGQPDYLELLSLLRSAGFSMWDLNPGFRAPASGRLLQFDAVFFRGE